MGLELLLPVILFILTLIIIFMLRSDDKRDRRLDLLKQRMQHFTKEVETIQSQFKDTAQLTEEKINKRVLEANQIMGRMDMQLGDLEARSEDLSKLQSVVNTYRDTLTQLGVTTSQVEERIDQVKQEIVRVESVQESIDSFDARLLAFRKEIEKSLAEMEESMQEHHLHVKQIQDASFAKLQSYELEVQETERANQARVASHSEAIQEQEAASLSILNQQISKLRQLGDDSEQILFNHKKVLEGSREQALEDLQVQQNQYELLKGESIKLFKLQSETLQEIETKARNQMMESMHRFVEESNGTVGVIFDHAIEKADVAFQTMIRTIQQFLNELTSRLEHAESVGNALLQTEQESLLEFSQRVQMLSAEALKAKDEQEETDTLHKEAAAGILLLQQASQTLHEQIEQLKTQKEVFEAQEQESHTQNLAESEAEPEAES
ncbi:MAG: hypothetical protein WC136_06935, partial [Sphaerochaeta sp.]